MLTLETMGTKPRAKSASNSIERDPRWSAVVARDKSADGRFVYSVRTTGVYCRPWCPSRLARPENVAFHANAAEAERAGFRACKRCKPAHASKPEPQAEHVVTICSLIERSDELPTLEQLAAHVGLSTSHTHRLFKAATGVTPRAYAASLRGTRMQRELSAAKTVTRAIYDAGYNSAGRFYAQAKTTLGMTPGQYRAGGKNERIRFAVGDCSLGSILVAATERGVCAVTLGDDPEALVHDLERRFPHAQLLGADAAFEQLVARVVGLVEAPRAPVQLPLDIAGTAFQQRVWSALARVPCGETISYAELAHAIGEPTAARAVARACASNPIAIAIPCHRVVRSDGALSGYRWGIERKRRLLDREAARPDGARGVRQ